MDSAWETAVRLSPLDHAFGANRVPLPRRASPLPSRGSSSSSKVHREEKHCTMIMPWDDGRRDLASGRNIKKYTQNSQAYSLNGNSAQSTKQPVARMSTWLGPGPLPQVILRPMIFSMPAAHLSSPADSTRMKSSLFLSQRHAS